MVNDTMSRNGSVAKEPTGGAGRAALLQEISGRWGKFSEDELSALQNNDELIAQIATKYSLDQARATSAVDGFLKGRRI